MDANALDHVALWVADRDTLADFVCAHLGMHVIERTDDFTLVGADARRGKLTLFAAEGPRDPGALVRVVLRVGDLEQALAGCRRPRGRPAGDGARDASRRPRAWGSGWSAAPDTDLDYDIDHVVLARARPGGERREARDARVRAGAATGCRWATSGCASSAGDGRDVERPLLNHIALLVDSGDDQLEEAERRGLDVAEVRDAANTFAVFLWGPDRHQARVRRAQAGLRARLDGCSDRRGPRT